MSAGGRLQGQGEGTLQECAVSLQCGLQLFEMHSPKQTAGGRADLAAIAVAHKYSLLSVSLSSPALQSRGDSYTHLTTVFLNHIC